MTRTEFEEICTYDELLNACYDLQYDSDLYYEIYNRDSYDDCIEEHISNCSCTWNELRDWLSDLPESYSGRYYTEDGYGNWKELNDGDCLFDDLKSEVRKYMEENDMFEEEYIEDEEDEYDDEPEDSESILSLFGDCKAQCVVCGS